MQSRKLLYIAFALALAAIGAAAAVARAGSAAPATDPTIAGREVECDVSASLLRRLGEAAEAYRTGTDVFIVADCQPPHTVAGVADAEEVAREIANEAPGTYAVFGPYRNPAGYESSPTAGAPTQTYAAAGRVLVPTCHEEPTEWISCFETAIWPCDSIEVTLSVRNVYNGEIQENTFAGCSVDAMFLTMPAIDKFAIPYYARVWGVERTAGARQDLLEWITSRSPDAQPDWLRSYQEPDSGGYR